MAHRHLREFPMFLVLMRSCECAPLEPGSRDAERSLTEAGIKDAVSCAIFLYSLGVEPKVVLTSPFKRTKQTAEILSEHLPENPPVVVAPYIMPGAGLDELMRSINTGLQCGDEDWVVAVGHEPDIGNSVRELLNLQSESCIPADCGVVIGMNVKNFEGKLTGKLIFTFSPIGMR